MNQIRRSKDKPPAGQDLPLYPGLPSRTGRTTAVVVPKKGGKRKPKSTPKEAPK